MNDRPSPTREIAHFIARILGARETTSEDVPHLLASVRDTIEALHGAPERLIPTPMTPTGPHTPRPRRQSAATGETPVRNRRRVELEPPAPAVVPRLMRRAEVAPPPEAPNFETRARQTGTLRGVVRWFDLNTRQGALRLPGFGDEVVIDASALERAGLSRLYKGQEIEATVVEDGGSARLVSLSLPGRVDAAQGVFKAGSARRNAKPVIVELKRDAMRRTAARIEAEQILGNGRDRAG